MLISIFENIAHEIFGLRDISNPQVLVEQYQMVTTLFVSYNSNISNWDITIITYHQLSIIKSIIAIKFELLICVMAVVFLFTNTWIWWQVLLLTSSYSLSLYFSLSRPVSPLWIVVTIDFVINSFRGSNAIFYRQIALL